MIPKYAPVYLDNSQLLTHHLWRCSHLLLLSTLVVLFPWSNIPLYTDPILRNTLKDDKFILHLFDFRSIAFRRNYQVENCPPFSEKRPVGVMGFRSMTLRSQNTLKQWQYALGAMIRRRNYLPCTYLVSLFVFKGSLISYELLVRFLYCTI